MTGFPELRGIARRLAAVFLVFSAPFLLPSLHSSESEEAEGEWHEFRDKQGNGVEARILSLAPDWRQIRIERRDGMVFELPVTRLSLDDQQNLRTWLLDRQAPDPQDVRIELTLEKKETNQEKTRIKSAVADATWEQSDVGYLLGVTSLSKVPLSSLKLEYYLLLEDAVSVSVSDSGTENETTQPWRTNRNQRIRYRYGSVSLPPLAFNRPHQVDTQTLTCDSVSTGRTGKTSFEDHVVGVVIRLLTEEGELIQSASEIVRGYPQFSWDQLLSMRDPGETEGIGVLSKTIASSQ